MNLILSMWMNAVSQPKTEQPVVVTEGRDEMAAMLARMAKLAEIDRLPAEAREEALKQLN